MSRQQKSSIFPRDVNDCMAVYTKDYSRSSHSSKLRQCIAEKDIPDPDFCRRPVNPFYSLSSSQFKFMDDHHSKDLETEYRKKINFFRQLR
ncbi:GL19551 [Drosophila persimilis]|uniref:GL19551 n=1 Tax=Drosophila persimilis TaxID=7234 RepID=B4G6M4_DROPE|nr:GL19551 [Drosophila persimilis]